MLIDSAMKADRRDVVSAMVAHETATRAVPPAQRAGYAAARALVTFLTLSGPNCSKPPLSGGASCQERT